jgi:Gpi18-like mannosyltransferase
MTKKVKLRTSLTALWLFNPLTFYNSSIWGQTDPIVNLLGIISIFFLINKKLIPSVLFFTMSLLFKGSLVIFLPLLLLIWVVQKHTIKEWLRAILISAFFSLIITIWFHPYFDLPLWLLNLYTQRFFPGEVGYLTANAFNLWYLVNPGKVLDNSLYYGVSAHTIGYVISILISVFLLIKTKASLTKEKTILFLLSAMALSSFLFFTRIHERYLYPFFPVATLLIAFIPELIFPYLIFSFIFLLNMYNLFWAPGIPFLENSLLNTSLPVVLSIINLLVFFYTIKIYFKNKSEV